MTTQERSETSKVRWHVTMSLDGFIAGPDHAMDWLTLSWLPHRPGVPALAREIAEMTGAILAGRRWYDALPRIGGLEGIYGGSWHGPVFVLTHRPEPPPEQPGITFLSEGLEAAVSTALGAASGRGVVVFGGDITRQALDSGLVDEILVHVAPVLLGKGIRLGERPGSEPVRLEPLELDSTGHLADLHYRVLK